MASWIYSPSLPLEETVGVRTIPSITTGALFFNLVRGDGSTPFLHVAHYQDSSLIGKGFLGDSSGSCALEVDMSETPCLSASIPLRSRQQARIYVVEDGSEEGIPQSKSTDLAHGVSMACPLGSSERN
ncbi:hypothetical protein V6N12_013011 [Hibiscus sabdariffa]|uniref:Uncharacterized protein n=1 Tax=Hibiscus sabdariffa TaxID=183260 RepID=A0ABR2EG31_9ROSI